MNAFLRTHLVGMFVFVSLVCPAAVGLSQVTSKVDLTIVPQSPPIESISVRFLPAEFELNDGNAAPILLRMPWEQNWFMANVYPKLSDYSRMEIDDPTLQELEFDAFAEKMNRAAFLRTADWEYDTDTDQPFLILLPDVQGLRQFVGPGMTAYVKQKLSRKDLMGACVGVETQMGCARHVSRTPILVNQLVALSLASNALDNVERIIEFKDAPNFYHTLALLPDEMGDMQASIEFDSHMLIQSLPSLKNTDLSVGGDGWKRVAGELAVTMKAFTENLTEAEAEGMLGNLNKVAKEALVKDLKFSPEQLEAMSPHEQIMRWVLYHHKNFSGQIQAAFRLPQQHAFVRLNEINKEINAVRDAGAKLIPLGANGPALYQTSKRFGRRVKLLQVVESIRDYAAKHDGSLPKSLDELELPAPLDPFNGKPFEYSVKDGTATLGMAETPACEHEVRRQYTIKIAK